MVAGDRKMKATGLLTNEWSNVRAIACHYDALGRSAFMTTLGGPRTVAANEETAYFFGSDDFDNSAGGGFAELEVSAVVSDGTNDFVSVVTNRVFVPPANETYAYDADGNMTEDARVRYYWNGENRMIRAEEKSAPNEQTQRVVTYAYDADGRMVLKSVAPVNAQPDKVTTYFWDAYNIVGECVNGEWTANLWGLDIDVTMQGTGGVGGLLAVAKGSDVYLPVYDGNGNITEYVAVDGVIAERSTVLAGTALLGYVRLSERTGSPSAEEVGAMAVAIASDASASPENVVTALRVGAERNVAAMLPAARYWARNGGGEFVRCVAISAVRDLGGDLPFLRSLLPARSAAEERAVMDAIGKTEGRR